MIFLSNPPHGVVLLFVLRANCRPAGCPTTKKPFIPLFLLNIILWS